MHKSWFCCFTARHQLLAKEYNGGGSYDSCDIRSANQTNSRALCLCWRSAIAVVASAPTTTVPSRSFVSSSCRIRGTIDGGDSTVQLNVHRALSLNVLYQDFVLGVERDGIFENLWEEVVSTT